MSAAQSGEEVTCPGACDHCAPDAWHYCQRPVEHYGLHSCQPTDEDTP